MSKNKSEKGITLYLSVVIMTMVLAIALGVSTIFLGQVKTMKGMGDSIIAFYAADAGIEKILITRDSPVNIPETPLSNGAAYRVVVRAKGVGGCASANYCIKSTGSYKDTNRAIEISY